MKKKRKIKQGQPLADFMPTILLKAKDFATEITIYNTKIHNMGTEHEISNEHITNNRSVRKTLMERGITPEQLLPAEDIKKLKKKLTLMIKNYGRSPNLNNRFRFFLPYKKRHFSTG